MLFTIIYVFALAVSASAFALSGTEQFRLFGNTKQKLEEMCGSSNVKLVFQWGAHLYYMDFSADAPQVNRIQGVTASGISSFLPVISPDGQWIAYVHGARDDGTGVDSSSVWIRELASAGTATKVADRGFVPRFVQNTGGDTLELVYATSAQCPGSPKRCDQAGKTVRRKIVVTNRTVLPETTLMDGSYYGGLSWNERYLNTGWLASGIDVLMKDLDNPSAAAKHMHTMAVKTSTTHRDTFIQLSSCNPSRSASRVYPDAMMFFDFSSGAIRHAKCYHPTLGEWGDHEVIFISRYGTGTYGTEVRAYWTPTDFEIYDPLGSSIVGVGEPVGRQWQNPEWSNHPYFAAASVVIDRLYATGDSWNHISKAEKVYMLDLRDGQSIRLVETVDTTILATTSIKNPYLWVEVEDGFEEDSAWLEGVILERPTSIQRPIGRLAPNPVVTLADDGLVRSTARIESVSVYSVLGRLIYRVSPQDPKSIKLSVYGPFRSGMYFVHVRTIDGSTAVLKWAVDTGRSTGGQESRK